jgi:hypothetical protein
MKTGRPLKFETADLMQDAIASYFKYCSAERLMPNKAGLCHSIKISRDTYNEYKKRFPDTVKEAEQFIEDAWVQRLAGTTPTGAIFYLKNAFSADYRDRQEVEHSGDLPFSVTIVQADGGAKN